MHPGRVIVAVSAVIDDRHTLAVPMAPDRSSAVESSARSLLHVSAGRACSRPRGGKH